MNSMFRTWFFKYGVQGAVDRWQGDEMENLVMSDVEIVNDVAALRRQVVRQGTIIEELASIVAVMSRMLADAGHLDAKTLEYRVEAELDERHAPPDAPPGTCIQCTRQRAGSELSFTAFGPVCAGGCSAS